MAPPWGGGVASGRGPVVFCGASLCALRLVPAIWDREMPLGRSFVSLARVGDVARDWPCGAAIELMVFWLHCMPRLCQAKIIKRFFEKLTSGHTSSVP